jgi:type I restriction enzyme M protein
MNHIEQSTMGTESEDDFNALFEDLDLNSTKIVAHQTPETKLLLKS